MRHGTIKATDDGRVGHMNHHTHPPRPCSDSPFHHPLHTITSAHNRVVSDTRPTTPPLSLSSTPLLRRRHRPSRRSLCEAKQQFHRECDIDTSHPPSRAASITIHSSSSSRSFQGNLRTFSAQCVRSSQTRTPSVVSSPTLAQRPPTHPLSFRPGDAHLPHSLDHPLVAHVRIRPCLPGEDQSDSEAENETPRLPHSTGPRVPRSPSYRLASRVTQAGRRVVWALDDASVAVTVPPPTTLSTRAGCTQRMVRVPRTGSAPARTDSPLARSAATAFIPRVSTSCHVSSEGGASARSRSASHSSCVPSRNDAPRRSSFHFPRVHNESASQAAVFEESVLPLAEAALRGQSVAVLCYGPTGSGKTYTMMGEMRARDAGARGNVETTVYRRAADEEEDENSAESDEETEKSLMNVQRYEEEKLTRTSEDSDASLDWSYHSGEDDTDAGGVVWPVLMAHTRGRQRQRHASIDASTKESVILGVREAAQGRGHELAHTPRHECTGKEPSMCDHRSTTVSRHAAAHTDTPHHSVEERTYDDDASGERAWGVLPRLVRLLLSQRGVPTSFSSSSSSCPASATGALCLTLREVTFYAVELYMDELYDLLDRGRRAITEVGSLSALCRHLDTVAAAAHRDGGGGVRLQTWTDFRRACQRARRQRATAQHARNDASSRSHALFIVRLEFTLSRVHNMGESNKCNSKHNTTVHNNNNNNNNIDIRSNSNHSSLCGSGPTSSALSVRHSTRMCAYVTLVDLAGSERVKETGVSGTALREARCINKSLAALGAVVRARFRRIAHIPYRDARLTRLLRPCLEQGRVLLLVHVAPCAAHDTLQSLRFANQLRRIAGTERYAELQDDDSDKGEHEGDDIYEEEEDEEGDYTIADEEDVEHDNDKDDDNDYDSDGSNEATRRDVMLHEVSHSRMPTTPMSRTRRRSATQPPASPAARQRAALQAAWITEMQQQTSHQTALAAALHRREAELRYLATALRLCYLRQHEDTLSAPHISDEEEAQEKKEEASTRTGDVGQERVIQVDVAHDPRQGGCDDRQHNVGMNSRTGEGDAQRVQCDDSPVCAKAVTAHSDTPHTPAARNPPYQSTSTRVCQHKVPNTMERSAHDVLDQSPRHASSPHAHNPLPFHEQATTFTPASQQTQRGSSRLPHSRVQHALHRHFAPLWQQRAQHITALTTARRFYRRVIAARSRRCGRRVHRRLRRAHAALQAVQTRRAQWVHAWAQEDAAQRAVAPSTSSAVLLQERELWATAVAVARTRLAGLVAWEQNVRAEWAARRRGVSDARSPSNPPGCVIHGKCAESSCDNDGQADGHGPHHSARACAAVVSSHSVSFSASSSRHNTAAADEEEEEPLSLARRQEAVVRATREEQMTLAQHRISLCAALRGRVWATRIWQTLWARAMCARLYVAAWRDGRALARVWRRCVTSGGVHTRVCDVAAAGTKERVDAHGRLLPMQDTVSSSVPCVSPRKGSALHDAQTSGVPMLPWPTGSGSLDALRDCYASSEALQRAAWTRLRQEGVWCWVTAEPAAGVHNTYSRRAALPTRMARATETSKGSTIRETRWGRWCVVTSSAAGRMRSCSSSASAACSTTRRGGVRAEMARATLTHARRTGRLDVSRTPTVLKDSGLSGATESGEELLQFCTRAATAAERPDQHELVPWLSFSANSPVQFCLQCNPPNDVQSDTIDEGEGAVVNANVAEIVITGGDAAGSAGGGAARWRLHWKDAAVSSTSHLESIELLLAGWAALLRHRRRRRDATSSCASALYTGRSGGVTMTMVTRSSRSEHICVCDDAACAQTAMRARVLSCMQQLSCESPPWSAPSSRSRRVHTGSCTQTRMVPHGMSESESADEADSSSSSSDTAAEEAAKQRMRVWGGAAAAAAAAASSSSTSAASMPESWTGWWDVWVELGRRQAQRRALRREVKPLIYDAADLVDEGCPGGRENDDAVRQEVVAAARMVTGLWSHRHRPPAAASSSSWSATTGKPVPEQTRSTQDGSFGSGVEEDTDGPGAVVSVTVCQARRWWGEVVPWTIWQWAIHWPQLQRLCDDACADKAGGVRTRVTLAPLPDYLLRACEHTEMNGAVYHVLFADTL